MKVPTHFRSAAMSDGPYGAPLCLCQRGITAPEARQEAAQHVDDGGGHVRVCGFFLTRQIAAERLDQCADFLLGAMGEMQVEHGGLDILVA